MPNCSALQCLRVDGGPEKIEQSWRPGYPRRTRERSTSTAERSRSRVASSKMSQAALMPSFDQGFFVDRR